MIYEIINPSDPYTMAAKNPQVAKFCNILLGNGLYGLKDEEGNKVLGIVFTDEELEEILKKEFGEDISEFMKTHKDEINDCFNSVMIGNLKDRPAYDEIIRKMNPADRNKYRKELLETKITSLNNIAEKAWRMAIGII